MEPRSDAARPRRALAFTRIAEEHLASPALTMAEKLVLAALFCGTYKPVIDTRVTAFTLSLRTAIHRDTVKRALRSLERKGLITMTRDPSAGSGRSVEGRSELIGGAQDPPPRGRKIPPRGGAKSYPLLIEEREKERGPESSAGDPSGPPPTPSETEDEDAWELAQFTAWANGSRDDPLTGHGQRMLAKRGLWPVKTDRPGGAATNDTPGPAELPGRVDSPYSSESPDQATRMTGLEPATSGVTGPGLPKSGCGSAGNSTHEKRSAESRDSSGANPRLSEPEVGAEVVHAPTAKGGAK